MITEPVEKRLRVVQILIAALMMGLLSASIVMTLLRVIGHTPPASGLTSTLALIVPALLVVTFGVGLFLSRTLLNQAKQQWESLPEPKDAAAFSMPKYEVVTILRGALLEGPGLVAAIATMLTGEFLFLIVPGFSLIALAANFPSKDRVLDFTDRVTGRRGS